MDKLRAFEFFTVLLPAGVVVLISAYILGIKLPDELANDNLINLIFFIPICYFMGYFISSFGYKIESIIDKIFKNEHPLNNILKNYEEVETKILELFPKLKTEKENVKDKIFDKCRIILYQQSYGERAQSMSMQATFFRNLLPSCLLIMCVFIGSYCCNNRLQLTGIQLSGGLFFLVVIFFFARIFSQDLYKKWFREVLNNIEIYFKLKNKS